ncbi:methyltransferase domain-containing protein [Solitalea lacus]|uniref:methyltransferase domain-containing protein n=1 Tax=Solitalea lacus TaxID=2911172 RepID=UPI001EDC0655|nr:methyltransferase domain-containing protein [Solitalea lacus]UKJ07524.1 TPMT family class I SAM-dependent methyltransferase [Solitalea lacus]
MKEIANNHESLNQAYWDDRYQNQQTGWDLGMVSPPLKAYIDQLSDKSISILIPGCGNAYEAEYLLNSGFTNVTVVDIAETLTTSLSQQLSPFISNGSLKIITGDFFEMEGQFDLILEQTFFCAIAPQMRENYVSKTHQLLKPDGRLVGVLFNRTFELQGPPFGGNKAEYITLFESKFELKTIDDCSNSVQPRAGTELFINFRKIN